MLSTKQTNLQQIQNTRQPKINLKSLTNTIYNARWILAWSIFTIMSRQHINGKSYYTVFMKMVNMKAC